MTKEEKKEEVKILVNEVKYAGMDSSKKPKLERILNVVCDVLKVDVNEVRGKNRRYDLVKARHCFFYLASAASRHYTLSKIGKITSSNHATVLHGKRKISNLMDVYQDELDLIFKMKERLNLVTVNYDNKQEITEAHVGYYDTPEKIKELEERLKKKKESI